MKKDQDLWAQTRDGVREHMKNKGVSCAEIARQVGEQYDPVHKWLSGRREPRAEVGFKFLILLKKEGVETFLT